MRFDVRRRLAAGFHFLSPLELRFAADIRAYRAEVRTVQVQEQRGAGRAAM